MEYLASFVRVHRARTLTCRKFGRARDGRSVHNAIHEVTFKASERQRPEGRGASGPGNFCRVALAEAGEVEQRENAAIIFLSLSVHLLTS